MNGFCGFFRGIGWFAMELDGWVWFTEVAYLYLSGMSVWVFLSRERVERPTVRTISCYLELEQRARPVEGSFASLLLPGSICNIRMYKNDNHGTDAWTPYIRR